ncbi:hypothetical protein [Halobacillus salinus]|uniref:Uncharacterized protein n=1 Tax=Halobacillus salinus TaxID=192814 RepID=A0A4Z0H088_9BACI|nr:hypothetical protein [Halobacillus salinus]TGB03872.1 hypothetical protein E4663_02370 [Halobacillus salinus]
MGAIYFSIIALVSLFALVSTVLIAMNQTKLQSIATVQDDVKQLMVENKSNSIPLLFAIYSVFFAFLLLMITWFFWL